MKKIHLTLSIIIIIILLICITYTLKQNKTILEENKRLKEIIELKQETNKEYVYLFKQTEKKNLSEENQNEILM